MTLRREAVEKIVPAQVEFTPHLLAEVFADMSDESQAQFFIDLAEIAATWGPDPHPQWYLIGRHLRTCSCATEASRELVLTIARGIGGPQEPSAQSARNSCPACQGGGYSNEVICRSPVAYRPCRSCNGSGISRPDSIAPEPGRGNAALTGGSGVTDA